MVAQHLFAGFEQSTLADAQVEYDCGASFETEAELTAHAREEHGVDG